MCQIEMGIRKGFAFIWDSFRLDGGNGKSGKITVRTKTETHFALKWRTLRKKSPISTHRVKLVKVL